MLLESCNAHDTPHNKELPCPSMWGGWETVPPVISQTLIVFNIISMLSTPKFLSPFQTRLPEYLLEISSGCLTAHQTQHIHNPTLAPYATFLIAQANNIGGILLDFIFSHPTSSPSANSFSSFLKTEPASMDQVPPVHCYHPDLFYHLSPQYRSPCCWTHPSTVPSQPNTQSGLLKI